MDLHTHEDHNIEWLSRVLKIPSKIVDELMEMRTNMSLDEFSKHLARITTVDNRRFDVISRVMYDRSSDDPSAFLVGRAY